MAYVRLDPDCKFILPLLEEDPVVFSIFTPPWALLQSAKHLPGVAMLFPIEWDSIRNGGH